MCLCLCLCCGVRPVDTGDVYSLQQEPGSPAHRRRGEHNMHCDGRRALHRLPVVSRLGAARVRRVRRGPAVAAARQRVAPRPPLLPHSGTRRLPQCSTPTFLEYSISFPSLCSAALLFLLYLFYELSHRICFAERERS